MGVYFCWCFVDIDSFIKSIFIFKMFGNFPKNKEGYSLLKNEGEKTTTYGSISDLQVCYLNIQGMTCDSCIYTIDSKISKKPGIRNISVDLKTEICAVIYDPNVTAPDFIIDYVHDLNEGFTATNKSNGQVFILHVQGLNCENVWPRLNPRLKIHRSKLIWYMEKLIVLVV